MCCLALWPPFFARLSRPMRIFLAVPSLAVLMVLAVVVVQFVQRLVGFVVCCGQGSNMALNLAPFGRWTLRDRAAQRRLALR